MTFVTPSNYIGPYSDPIRRDSYTLYLSEFIILRGLKVNKKKGYFSTQVIRNFLSDGLMHGTCT